MLVPLYFSEVFCGKNNDVLKENETIKFPKLAQTYRKIAEEGADAFYNGTLAQNLVADIQSAGSVAAVRVNNETKVLWRVQKKLAPLSLSCMHADRRRRMIAPNKNSNSFFCTVSSVRSS